MERTYISKIKIGSTVKVCGFVENLRNKRTIAFIVLKDSTGRVQLTVRKEKSAELSAILDDITLQSFITVQGKVVANEHVKLNGVEILPTSIKIESTADALPVHCEEKAGTDKSGVERSSIDQRLDYRWLDLRTDKNLLMFKVQTLMTAAMRNFLLEQNFIEIHSPKLVGAASESGADVFKVDYFSRAAYLAQSPQFYKQMAIASGFDRVFEVAPVFRAEKSYTSKHATEFTGFDLEMSCIDSFKDIMHLQENLTADMLAEVYNAYGEEMKSLFEIEPIVPTLPFPVMRLCDVYTELESLYGFKIDKSEQGDLTTEAERLCAKLSKDKFNHEFLFITDFDAHKRAFYHMQKDGIPQGYDLIWRGVEITTGAQREHRYDILIQQAQQKGLAEDVKFYLEFFKYGCPPHGGFGLGIDRLSMILCNTTIKEAMFIFRGPHRLTP